MWGKRVLINGLIAVTLLAGLLPVTAGNGVGIRTREKGGGNNDEFRGPTYNVPWSNIRLPSTVVPQLYDISLSLDMDTFQVTGLVNILCSVEDTVDYIALHAKNMTIPSDGHHLLRGGREVPHNSVIYPENDFFIFNLTSPMKPGSINIILQFGYSLRQELNGFYRSSYTDETGKVQYLATTYFGTTYARKAFPCFDEPAMKASFTLHMTYQSRYRAWSNMPSTSRTSQDLAGLVTTHFMPTRRMSTFLVAFIVSEFECVGDAITSTSGNQIMVKFLVYIHVAVTL